MNTTRLHSLAEQYLGRLDAEARFLPDQDREELLAEVRGHLEAGLPKDASDADVRNLLRDLGSPVDIAAAAAAESGPGPAFEQTPRERRGDASPASPWGLVEILAVVGLTVGAFLLPVIGPLVGVCLAWASPRWTRREKTVATVLTFLPLVALALGAAVLMSSGPSRPVPSAPVAHLIVGVAS
jgi:uncharacterized membrane protein